MTTTKRFLILLSVTLAALGACATEAPVPAERISTTITVPNGSSDGRYHTCGFVTEDGVTEHLDAYKARCGDTTYAGDTGT